MPRFMDQGPCNKICCPFTATNIQFEIHEFSQQNAQKLLNEFWLAYYLTPVYGLFMLYDPCDPCGTF